MSVLERDRHITILDGHLAEVTEGKGRLVLIAGEAGVGKTALVDTLERPNRYPPLPVPRPTTTPMLAR